MRIISHGVDIVLCSRIERLWRDHGEAFLARIFSESERAYCLNTKVAVERLSGRFAVKEAVMKALGTGWRGGILWTDIETLPDGMGRPVCRLTGRTAELAGERGIVEMQVSISHAGEYAVATAIGVGGC
jgi:holo-[acyl-carrier protein] synthase